MTDISAQELSSMNSKKAVIVLADGFEEIEAFIPMDVLRRLGFNVILTGLNGCSVRGAHGLSVQADLDFKNCDLSVADAIILPGGLPGAVNLQASAALRSELRRAAAQGRITAAICAAPIVLQDAGLLDNKVYTGYPGSEKLAKKQGMCYTGNMTEKDGTVITAKGPGAAFLFSREIALALGCPENVFQNLSDGMMVKL